MQLFIWEIRESGDFECLRLRDWLHDAMTFDAYTTKGAAIEAARAAVETLHEDEGDDAVTIVKWNEKDYTDGAWFELSNGEEGRVIIHAIKAPVWDRGDHVEPIDQPDLVGFVDTVTSTSDSYTCTIRRADGRLVMAQDLPCPEEWPHEGPVQFDQDELSRV